MPKYQKFNGKLNLGGDLIEEARLRQGLTREEVAKRLKDYNIPMSRSALYKIEKGKRRLYYHEFAFLTRILELDPVEIEGTILKRLDALQRNNRQ